MFKVIGIHKDFMNRTPTTQKIVQRINKQDHIKFKFLHSKENDQQREEIACRMGRKLAQHVLELKMNIQNIERTQKNRSTKINDTVKKWVTETDKSQNYKQPTNT